MVWPDPGSSALGLQCTKQRSPLTGETGSVPLPLHGMLCKPGYKAESLYTLPGPQANSSPEALRAKDSRLGKHKDVFCSVLVLISTTLPCPALPLGPGCGGVCGGFGLKTCLCVRFLVGPALC